MSSPQSNMMVVDLNLSTLHGKVGCPERQYWKKKILKSNHFCQQSITEKVKKKKKSEFNETDHQLSLEQCVNSANFPYGFLLFTVLDTTVLSIQYMQKSLIVPTIS